ncbi:hypothetical protein LUZ60_017429 [Juncus effusus]|nr:hypothetical protein LUZ60_017429 [Juncus effusus]
MGDNKARSETTTGIKCVLCSREARTYCESDEATLCWDCDSRVHSANFLVARHSRALLCRSCRRPTAWKASGERLPPTNSLCPQCCFRTESESNGDNGEGETEDEEEEEEEEMEMEEEEEEGDNQVVPWGMAGVGPPGVSEGSSSDGSMVKKEGSMNGMRNLDERPTSTQWRDEIMDDGRTEGGDEATSSKEEQRFDQAEGRNKSLAISCSSARKNISTSDFIHC